MAKVTSQMLLDLFDAGIVIHRAWIMPDRYWEYTVVPAGCITGTGKDIATRSTLSAAYNAARKYLSAQQSMHADQKRAGSKSKRLSTSATSGR